MLVLGRRVDTWTLIEHRSGDVLRLLVVGVRAGEPKVDLGFDDPPRRFEVSRPERKRAGLGSQEPRPGRAPRPTTTAEAAAVLTARRHRGGAWYASGDSAYGPDPLDVLSPFEAIAIARAYLDRPDDRPRA